MRLPVWLWGVLLAAGPALWAASAGTDSLRLIPIEPGKFRMGELHSTAHLIGPPPLLADGDYDERPVHEVEITKPFLMSETEVPSALYRQFDPNYPGTGEYAQGVSWHEAMRFCAWLSEKEGKPYRLPTEAEWEYACRAGSDTLYPGGDRMPEEGEANAWGLKNMLSGVGEWCLDWHGLYPPEAQVDPVGPASGDTKVYRGGPAFALPNYEFPAFYRRSANRSSMPPDFPPGRLPQSATAPPSPLSVVPEPIDAEGREPGLIGNWFAQSNTSTRQASEVLKTVDVTFGPGRGKQWKAKWIGGLRGPVDGDVTVYLKSDGGGTLALGGQTVQGNSAKIVLPMRKDRVEPIVLSYQNSGKSEVGRLRVLWSFDGAKPQPVPDTAISYSRADFLNEFRAEAGTSEVPALHHVGFRVVQAPMPGTKPLAVETPFFEQAVKQTDPMPGAGPPAEKPFFRCLPVLPIPPENSLPAEIAALDFAPGMLYHNHSPALVVCPNGDLLLCYFTASSPRHEAWANVGFIFLRLRRGAQQWDMPDFAFDCADLMEASPAFFRDGSDIWFIGGTRGIPADVRVPFRWRVSRDSGATWSATQFPVMAGPIGPHFAQPKPNGIFRDRDGWIFIPTDGAGASSLLWASRDNGRTWFDTGGRTRGRHTTFVPLKDGAILGLGGKEGGIDGWMPRNISRDKGRTWEVSVTPFPDLGGNQRPSVLRLRSGRLFFASDFQMINDKKPAGVAQSGSFVALSEDEGRSWHVKPLPGSQRHEGAVVKREGIAYAASYSPGGITGYNCAEQSEDGVIHLITSMNHPNLHFQMNEAWILSDDAETLPEPAEGKTKTFEQRFADGTLQAKWQALTGGTAGYLMHGPETWYYADGTKQYEVTWDRGRKIGKETWCGPDGQPRWQWRRDPDGRSTWTQWWPNGQKKAESHWRALVADGPATRWAPDGKVLSEVQFVNGVISR